MPGQSREIRRRIKSIKSTRQITKAMEMVSAAKMRRAVANVLATRPYATLAWDMVKEISQKSHSGSHALLEERENIKKIGLILITSNRGLAGSFNANVINLARSFIRRHREEVKVEADLVIMGKKGRDVVVKHGHTVIAEFTKVDVTTRVDEVRPLARLAMEEYLKGTYDRIVMVYTDFVSTLTQKPRVKQLLPIVGEDPYLGQLGKVEAPIRPNDANTRQAFEGVVDASEGAIEDGYLFEPSPKAVLDELLPRLVEMQIYQAILESDASEHSARMLAMKNASEAAGDMMNELTLLFNQTRQAGITQEIAEISAGRIAIER
jgi:F-type H+-transporting ATPase subunit gamma